MIDKIIEVERIEDVINVFGSFDQNLRILESELGVKVLDREDVLHICGEGEDVLLAEKAISGLLTLAAKGEQINDQNVRYVLKLVRQGREDKIQELVGDVNGDGKISNADAMVILRYVVKLRVAGNIGQIVYL